jgi:hypothetical protein
VTTSPKTKPTEGNDLPHQGDHDRVQMLSLRADGTPDQVNPEIIGDPDTAEAAAKEQFAQQAVSALDVATSTGPVTLVGQKDGSTKAIPATTGQDPTIESATKAAQEATTAAEAAATAAVAALKSTTGDQA